MNNYIITTLFFLIHFFITCNPALVRTPINRENPNDEQILGHRVDIYGTNAHYYQPKYFKDLHRRFAFQHPYQRSGLDQVSEQSSGEAVEKGPLVPLKAPPELVLAVAAESKKIAASRPYNPSDQAINKEILRTGDYWNGVRKEDFVKYPHKLLRTANERTQKRKYKYTQETELEKLIKALSGTSPKLIYVINTK